MFLPFAKVNKEELKGSKLFDSKQNIKIRNAKVVISCNNCSFQKKVSINLYLNEFLTLLDVFQCFLDNVNPKPIVNELFKTSL